MADSDDHLGGVPIVRATFDRTVRLVTSARLREAVLKPLVDSEEELTLLAEIEGATSTRLIAQDHGVGGIAANELVHGVPHAAFINASFSYAKPREPNRFNGSSRGAWYSAVSIDTCIAEVGHHMTKALADAGDYNAIVEYAEMHASFAGEFLGLREVTNHPALHADPRIGYPAGNSLAAMALGKGLNGIIYPSVRHAGGVCIVGLRPHAVQSVAQGAVIRLQWDGTPTPKVSRPEEG